MERSELGASALITFSSLPDNDSKQNENAIEITERNQSQNDQNLNEIEVIQEIVKLKDSADCVEHNFIPMPSTRSESTPSVRSNSFTSDSSRSDEEHDDDRLHFQLKQFNNNLVELVSRIFKQKSESLIYSNIIK